MPLGGAVIPLHEKLMSSGQADIIYKFIMHTVAVKLGIARYCMVAIEHIFLSEE